MAIAITVAVIIGGLVALAITLRRGASKAKKPLARTPPGAGWLPPPPGQRDPGFIIVNHQPDGGADHGFTVVHPGTGRRRVVPPRGHGATRGGSRSGAAGFSFIVSGNPTAICKLTGRQVRDCSCDKHGRKR